MKYLTLVLALLPLFLVQTSCFQVKAKEPVVYRFKEGKTALLRDGFAYAPRRAPKAVIRAIAAGNRLQGKPYKWGGGHGRMNDSGYDCSGSVSYVLREAGLMKGCLTSNSYFKYGKRGYGDWITIYVRRGHVFVTIAGLRLDTGGDSSNSGSGPSWKPARRGVKGFIVRHPSGY
jgi:hypothetical protein